ncbi:MAG: hypothetical protein R2774_04525 [Saprospiraceae bacterium]
MRIKFSLLVLGCIVSSCVFDPPKETILIVNTSSRDTIYVFSGHCRENMDSIVKPKKRYFNKGFNRIIKNPYFLEPLDTLKLSLGYTLLPSILSCTDKEAKAFIIRENLLLSTKDTFMNDKMVDTVFSFTEKTIKDGIFYYKPRN